MVVNKLMLGLFVWCFYYFCGDVYVFNVTEQNITVQNIAHALEGGKNSELGIVQL